MVDPVSTKQLTSILKIKHFKNKLSCLFDFSIFMDLESQMSSLFKISLAEKVTIPPKTEVITIGKIEGDSSSIMNALVQPLQSNHLENILVAKSLVDPSRGYVPTMVLITPPSAKHSFVLVFFISGLMFGGSRLYFLGCKIQMVDPVSQQISVVTQGP
jgi:hypothetical protein